MRLHCSLVVCLAFGATACTELKQGQEAPEGVQCKQIVLGGSDGPSLQKVLASASPGDCVIVDSKTYKGSFDVPQGVTVTSAKGSRAILQGTSADKAAIAIVGGQGSGLCNLAVRDSVGFGISVKGGPVLIKDVVVEKSLKAGIATTCESCNESQKLELRDVRLRENKLGAWFRGSVVIWTGGQSSVNKSTSITGGAGIIAHDGARLSLTNVTIENNESVGVLLAGDRTSGAFENVRVAGNSERGLWAQRLKPASADQPALRISGNSVIENNAVVGIGVFEATGIEIEGATVRGTQMRRLQFEGLAPADVGDGILFVKSSGQVRDVTLAGNPRAAALIDEPAAEGIRVENPRITAPSSGYKIVVQNDQAKRADVPANEVTTTEKALAFPAELNTGELTSQ